MAGELVVGDWSGLDSFPPATQTQLHYLLANLKQENVNSLTILVMGKCGVGKSSTVNSIVGERAVSVSAFQSESPRPAIVSRSRAGITLNIIDTPGLIDGGYVNNQALELTKRFLLNKTIDVLLYVDRFDTYRVDKLDTQVVKSISNVFGKRIWSKSLVVLTHAQLSPPDGLSYDVFYSKRSEALLNYIYLGAGMKEQGVQAFLSARMKKQDIQGSTIPVVLVENSGRCNKNEFEEKVLPDGTAWIPNLVKSITEVALNGRKPILVDKRLIEMSNPNKRGKIFVPLIFALQYLFVIKPIKHAIKSDEAKKSKLAWEL